MLNLLSAFKLVWHRAMSALHGVCKVQGRPEQGFTAHTGSRNCRTRGFPWAFFSTSMVEVTSGDRSVWEVFTWFTVTELVMGDVLRSNESWAVSWLDWGQTTEFLLHLSWHWWSKTFETYMFLFTLPQRGQGFYLEIFYWGQTEVMKAATWRLENEKRINK